MWLSILFNDTIYQNMYQKDEEHGERESCSFAKTSLIIISLDHMSIYLLAMLIYNKSTKPASLVNIVVLAQAKPVT